MYELFAPFPSDYTIENNAPTVLLVLALVLALQVIVVRGVAARDHFLSEVMIVGFLLKLAAVSAYLLMITRVYGFADAFFYFYEGSKIVNKFSLTGEWAFLRPFWSTNFIVMLTSWLIFVFGPTFQALMIIFAAVSYWGQYLFYRAFCMAFPKRQHTAAALFMFLLPSLVYWTATIGKDAVIFFFIGGCCYGIAKIARTRPDGLLITLASLCGAMLVRPHVAIILAASLGTAYLISRNRSGAKGMALKICGVPLLLFANLFFFSQARAFLNADATVVGHMQNGLLDRGRISLESRGAANFQEPGQAFGSSLSSRLLASPFLLFRPFPWEVRNPQMAVAAVEAFGLMMFAWRRRKALRLSLRKWRENPVVPFLWLSFLEFSLLFAPSMTNFGELARERDMLLPLALMICLSQPLSCTQHWRARNANRFALATHS